jgi:N-acetylglutamate synthase-like GNAT family acetyltransferase
MVDLTLGSVHTQPLHTATLPMLTQTILQVICAPTPMATCSSCRLDCCVHAERHINGAWVPACGRAGHTLQLVRGASAARPRGAKRAMRHALAVLKEGFDPIVDESSGRDIIEMMVMGESSEAWDFQNMCVVLLCEHSTPVVAAVVRVLGPLMMEVPLIATRRAARRRGHCRVLLDGLAETLAPVGLDQVLLPAHDDALDAWVGGFGFAHVSGEELETVRRHLRMVLFPETTVLKLPAAAAARPPRAGAAARQQQATAVVAFAPSSPVASAAALAAVAWKVPAAAVACGATVAGVAAAAAAGVDLFHEQLPAPISSAALEPPSTGLMSPTAWHSVPSAFGSQPVSLFSPRRGGGAPGRGRGQGGRPNKRPRVDDDAAAPATREGCIKARASRIQGVRQSWPW